MGDMNEMYLEEWTERKGWRERGRGVAGRVLRSLRFVSGDAVVCALCVHCVCIV